MSESMIGSSLRRWVSRCAVIAAVIIGLAPSAFAQVIQTNEHGFGDRQNSYAWSMAWHNGKLYVGTGRSVVCVERSTILFYFPLLAPIITPYSDPLVPCPLDPFDLDLRAEIWQYTPSTKVWKRVFQSPADLPNPLEPGKFIARDIGFRDMVEFKESNGTTALFIAGVSAREYVRTANFTPYLLPPPRILRSVDGETWTPVPQDPGTVLGDLQAVTFRAMKIFDKRLFVTASPGLTGDGFILEASTPKNGNNAFKIVSPLEMHVFEMEVFNGQLYVGTGDTTTGYGVSRTKATGTVPYQFTPVVTDGAGRGSIMTSVVSMHPFKGRLYVGSSGWQTGQLPGSELIRIKPNGQWDLVVGNARTVGAETKSPISGIADSFGNPFNFHFWRMQEDHGVLMLTTNDGSFGFRTPLLDPFLKDEYGFDMFATNDGVFWTQLTKNGFDSFTDFGGRTMASTPSGLFVGTANHALGTAVLLGNFPRPLPSQLTRLTSENRPDGTLLSWDASTTGRSAKILRAEYKLRPPDQQAIDAPPGGFVELPEDLVVGDFVEVGRTADSFFFDGSGVPNTPYAYKVEPVDGVGLPAFQSNFGFSLTPPATLSQVSAMLSGMIQRGTVKSLGGPLASHLSYMTAFLNSGQLGGLYDEAQTFYKLVSKNPGGVILDPLDGEDLELLADEFLRRVQMCTAGLLSMDSLK